jgi:hypothetical protein
MFECPTCKKIFGSKPAFSSHWGLICKPGARGRVIGEDHPKFGKKGRNGYTDRDWSSIPFDDLNFGQRRKRLLEECNYACTSCGFSKTRNCGRTILEVDHIDGDHSNNKRENLRVLCPNCHALTPNFRNWGRGKERTSTRFRKGNVGFAEAKEERDNESENLRRLQDETVVRAVTEAFESGDIDFRRWGWIGRLNSYLTNRYNTMFANQTVGRKVKELMPAFYEQHCYKRL